MDHFSRETKSEIETCGEFEFDTAAPDRFNFAQH